MKEVGDPYSQSRSERNEIEYTLIKKQNKKHLNLDLYNLIEPVLFWCDFAVEKEARINIFKPAWKALVALIEALPVDTNTELIPIILPYLARINEFAEKSSPTLSMLKFMNLILKPINENLKPYEYPKNKAHKHLTSFILSFILNFVKWVPHNLNEEAFKVLDSLLYTVRPSLEMVHIKAVTLALLDKYTMRSKIHKKLTNTFISLLLSHSSYSQINTYQTQPQTYIDYFISVIISESACIKNFTQAANQEKVDFLEKVNLLNLLISDMQDQHILLFDRIVRNTELVSFLTQMVKSEVTSI